MKFFVDSADINDIKELNAIGVVDGVTTNPSLVSKVNKDYQELLKDICAEVTGPVSAEVKTSSAENMVSEGRELAKIASNIVIKIPLTVDGLKACRVLVNEGNQVNVTLCFSAVQAILAAKAGATFISPFVGRLDDISSYGMQLIDDIYTIYNNYEDINTKILVASVRNTLHVLEAAKIGAHVVTLPPKVLFDLVKHPLTDKGIDIFNQALK